MSLKSGPVVPSLAPFQRNHLSKQGNNRGEGPALPSYSVLGSILLGYVAEFWIVVSESLKWEIRTSE